MGIGGIGDYSSILSNYRIPVIPTVSVEEVRRQTEQNAAVVSPATEPVSSATSAVVRKPDAALEDISLTFNRQDDFGYIGSESDIRSLDMEKAISDMRKDEVLQQYQYFVGSARAILDNPDGTVIAKF